MSQKLITIDPSLAGSSLDARSAVRDTTNDERASFWNINTIIFYCSKAIILPTSTSKANVPGTEDLPSPTPGEVNTSETEANALHVTPVMNKIAETSSIKDRSFIFFK
ncbi:unnamed protein product [Rhizophagus irregularis]|nr:unnamed protein product [Rhizophagus irregularis]CAB4438211.1 unnamed protein product [Rhizophagus irregularis]